MNAVAEERPSTTYDDLLALTGERREQVLALDRFLRAETAWATAPASTRFHLCRPGGLVEHGVNVARLMLELREKLAPELPVPSCVITALYHDAGKAGWPSYAKAREGGPGQAYYLPWPKDWRPSRYGARYTINQDLPFMDVASRSLALVSKFVDLSAEEAQAIRYHDGQYVEENAGVAQKECRLTRLLQMADNWAGCEMEERG